jgi:hypothetical protein
MSRQTRTYLQALGMGRQYHLHSILFETLPANSEVGPRLGLGSGTGGQVQRVASWTRR